MKKILIIGAGFLQSYLIKRAKDIGYYTFAVDGNDKAPGFKFADEYAVIDIVDKSACLKFALEKQVDGVLTAATDYGVLTASYIAERMKLPGIKYDVVKIIKNKYKVKKKLLESHSDDTHEAYEISSDVDIKSICKIVKFPVIVKPSDGSGSRGVSKAENAEEFIVSCREAIMNSLNHNALVEKFIIGEEYGVESFVYEGKITVLAVLKKWMTKAPYYAELGHSIPSCLDVKTEQHIKQCVKNAIRALNINFGSVNVDLLLSKDGEIHIVDIGVRMGGNLIGSHIIPIGTGINYMDIILRASVKDYFSFEQKCTPQKVVTRLLALKPGKIKVLPNFEKIEQELNVKIYHHLVLGGEIHEYHTNLDGCGYIVSVSESYEIALQNAETALIRINEEIVRY